MLSYLSLDWRCYARGDFGLGRVWFVFICGVVMPRGNLLQASDVGMYVVPFKLRDLHFMWCSVQRCPLVLLESL